MLRLKLFGAPSLELDGVPVTGRAAQRHRLALLALLAVAPGRRLGRDRLIATLWPESDAERGRNLLKVATYVLRSALADDVLHSSGDELRLDDAVETDVAEFEAALERGDHAQAVSLHEGPFMDGFFLNGAPGFDQWVERERERLGAARRRALEVLAGEAEAARDWQAAVSWWRIVATSDPYDSRVAVRLMEALDASGNRAGAIQYASLHQRLLEEELGVASVPTVATLAERLRREPASYVPDVAPPVREPTPRPVPPDERAAAIAGAVGEPPAPPFPPSVAVPAPAGGSRRRRAAAVVLLALFAPVAIAAAAWLAWRGRAGVAPARSIVVLPFANLSGEDDQYFSDGLTEEIITRLAAVPGLRVISRTSAMHYKGTTKPLPEIARELKVDHILEGSVRRDGGRARISAQLIDARDDGHLWAESFELDLGDRLRAQERIAHEVAEALQVRLQPPVERRLVRRGTGDPVAYELYQRGRWHWNTRTREGHERAIEYFGRAIARDSAYADAYAGLAHVYLTAFQLRVLDFPEQDAYKRLEWAAERALSLDDESADAHLAFAIALKWQRNWPGAEREFRRAIELNPGDATARSWYSLLLRGMGRGTEALRQSRTATELDPFGIVVTNNHGFQCFHERDWACAAERFRHAIEIGQYPGAWRWLGLTLAMTGRPEESIAAVERAIAVAPHRPEFVADLAYVLARAGRTAEARETLARAKRDPVEGFNIARAHVALGEADSAFAWLDRSNWKWSHRASRDDPTLDPLRADPRFAQLGDRVEREMGLR